MSRKPLPNSIQALGLKDFVNKFYMYDGERFLGGYEVLERQFKLGLSDTQIGAYFGRSRQQISKLRQHYTAGMEAKQ